MADILRMSWCSPNGGNSRGVLVTSSIHYYLYSEYKLEVLRQELTNIRFFYKNQNLTYSTSPSIHMLCSKGKQKHKATASPSKSTLSPASVSKTQAPHCCKQCTGCPLCTSVECIHSAAYCAAAAQVALTLYYNARYGCFNTNIF